MEQPQPQAPEAQPTTASEPVAADLAPLDIIRTETVLSRLPIHNLAKKGTVSIRIIRKDPNGQVELLWTVSPSRDFGEPRQLAFKLDTLIVNRRIEEEARPLPEIIRLGSLREIARELGLGSDTAAVRKALLQNASAFITAKLTYKGVDNLVHQLEAGFARYGVIFTGEKLSTGKRADAVYIELHPRYREVLNNAPVRPLNYNYLKQLAPAPQRFYEIVSYRIFAAFQQRRPEAKLAYSDYCTFSAQQRYFEYNHFKKQMYKIHRPHLQSGYIKSVRYEQSNDTEGRLDWLMFYVPGPRAKAEFMTFTRKQQAQTGEAHSAVEQMPANAASESKSVPEPVSSEQLPLVHSVDPTELVRYFHERRGVKEYEVREGSREYKLAEELLSAHNWSVAKFIVDYAINEAEQTGFRMRTLGGVRQYVSEAVAAYNRHLEEVARAQQSAQSQEAQWQREEEERRKKRERLAALAPDRYQVVFDQAKARLALKMPWARQQLDTAEWQRAIESEMMRIIEAAPEETTT